MRLPVLFPLLVLLAAIQIPPPNIFVRYVLEVREADTGGIVDGFPQVAGVVYGTSKTGRPVAFVWCRVENF